MLIEEALFALLSSDNAIVEIVGSNIYPVTMPQLETTKTFYPALVFSLTGRDREQSHDGPERLVASHFDLSCLGPKYFEVKTLAKKVRLALNGQSAALAARYGDRVRGVFLQQERDEYVYDEVEELALYHVPLSFDVHHWEELA